MNKVDHYSSFPCNLNTMCRACMSSDNEKMEYLFDNCLSDVFMACTSLDISNNDRLPKKLCETCITKMKASHEFQRQCRISEQTLLVYINEHLNYDASAYSSIREDSKTPPCETIMEACCKSEIIQTETPLNVEYDMEESSTSSQECPVCRKTFLYSKSFEKHKNSCIKPSKKPTVRNLKCEIPLNMCGLCNMQFEEIGSLNEHLEHHKQSESLSCKFTGCQFLGLDWADFFCHRYVHQPDSTRRLKCWTCENTFFNVDCLEFHIRSEHLGKLPGLCKICCKEFTNIKNFKAHKLTHLDFKPNKCNICSKRFTYKRSLILHLRCHSDVKKYVCHICGVTFKFRTNFMSHQFRKHTNQSGVICDHCNKLFKNKITLKEHLSRVTCPKEHKCLDCGKMYKSQKELFLHSKWHSDLKPYSCDHCGKSYKSKSHLTNHLRRHTGERPYQCDICHKSFMVANVLKKHKMIHTGERPHVCKVCDKSFIQMTNLNTHMKTHKNKS